MKTVAYANQATSTVLSNEILLSVVVRIICALNGNLYSYKIDVIVF